MAVREVLPLGNSRLYEISAPVQGDELPEMAPVAADLHGTLMDFRNKHGAGRAVAAPSPSAAR